LPEASEKMPIDLALIKLEEPLFRCVGVLPLEAIPEKLKLAADVVIGHCCPLCTENLIRL
jgi:hypothetical protein